MGEGRGERREGKRWIVHVRVHFGIMNRASLERVLIVV